tara:strand:+ start:70 stop:1818 length:1749 start_codon:yes stop_codon:yes gene_type:complete
MIVSLVTPTRLDRILFLKLLCKCIKSQDYKNIKEWIIIGGDENNQPLKYKIDELYKQYKNLPRLVWVDPGKKLPIGALRNRGNDVVSGNIVVCMDDDDYYPPQRVSHVVTMFLMYKDKNVAGCTKHFMYDVDSDLFLQWSGFGPNHATNNTLAYRATYIKNNRYDDLKTFAEEPTFLKTFAEPMIQLNPEKTVVQIAHTGNTFSKREQISNMYILKNQKQSSLQFSNKKKKLFPKQLQINYSTICDDKTSYDIVYYLGTNPVKWKPDDPKIGGSEQAIVELSEYWATKGYNICVFGDFDEHFVRNNVSYKSWKRFNLKGEHKILILWRLYGCFLLNLNLHAKKIYVDLHDNHCFEDIGKYVNKISKIMVKSQFHKNIIDSKIAKESLVYKIIPNGIRDIFFKDNNIPRQRFRFIYASSYLRGLEFILAKLFPAIISLIPNAELHIFYGMGDINNEEFKNHIYKLLKQPNVYEYGRQPVDRILEEKSKADFHLYISETTAETDCISIKESSALGCIPILTNAHVFNERPGIHVDSPFNILNLCNLLKNDEYINKLRNEGKCHPSVLHWNQVAETWLTEFSLTH